MKCSIINYLLISTLCLLIIGSCEESKVTNSGENTNTLNSSDDQGSLPEIQVAKEANKLGPQKVKRTPVSKGDLFASPNGSDGSCTQSDPCSLETAISESNAGDIVLLRGGIYGVGDSGILRFNRSGQSDAAITYESYPGELAVIDGTELNADPWSSAIRVNGDWNTIRRIEVRNMPTTGIFIDGNHNLIDGVISHDNYYSGIQVFSPYDDYPYGAKGSYNTIQNSVTYNNFDIGGPANGGDADGISISSGEGNKILHNHVYDNSDDGVDVWRSTNSVVAYNIVSGSGRADGNGNGIKAGGSEPSRGTLVHNNVAYNNRVTGIDYNLGKELNFYNNTSFSNRYGYSGNEEVTLKNNISFENEREWVSSAYNERNSWQDGISVSSEDFLSLNPESAKFLQLAPGSALIDAGVDAGLPFKGDAPDLGAYEYGADR